MDRIRTLAIENIRAALAPDKLLLPYRLLSLGQRYRVDEWVIAAVTFLITRVEPMGLIDVEAIGIENTLKIASLRECCIQHNFLPQIRLGEKRRKFEGELVDTTRIKDLFDLTE